MPENKKYIDNKTYKKVSVKKLSMKPFIFNQIFNGDLVLILYHSNGFQLVGHY